MGVLSKYNIVKLKKLIKKKSEKFKKFLADLNVPDPTTIEAANIDGATEVPHENHA